MFRMSFGFNSLVGVVGLFLCGCVARAPDGRMLDVAEMAPGSWSASKEGRAGVDRGWVRRFGDSGLSKLVNEAVVRNPDMRIAAERVDQARRTARMAGSDGRLKANLGLDGERRKIQFIGFPFGGSQISNTYGANATVSWEPDLWGRVRAGSSAAIADAQAIELDGKAARASLAAEVCKAWFSLSEAREQLSLAQRALKIRKDTVEAVGDRFERALAEEGGTASQLRLAQTDEATAMATVSQRRGEVETAQRRLELLAGRYPKGVLGGSAKLPGLGGSVPSGLPSGLLKRRPDILAAERRFAAAGKRIKEARLAVYPSFNLTATGGTSTGDLGDVLNSNFGIWSLAGGVTQNVLTGGLVTGEKAKRDSKEREELANLQKTVLVAFGEVEGSLSNERWLGRRIGELGKAYDLAGEAAESADADYRAATGDVLTLLTAQSRRIEIGSQILVLRRLRLENRVDLFLALGGDF